MHKYIVTGHDWRMFSWNLTLKVRTASIEGKWSSLAVAVAPCTGKIITNGPQWSERGENLLQNGILYFAFRLSQLSKIILQS